MKRRITKDREVERRHAMPQQQARRPYASQAMRIALGLGTSLAAGLAAAQSSSVTMYGLVDVGLEVSRSGTGTQNRMISGGSAGSRLGFRGSEDLGGGLAANFKLEQGFTPTDGNLSQGGRGFGREASVGLSSKTFGNFSMGRIPMPYYLALNGIDAFSWVGSGGMLSLTQSSTTSRQLLPLAITARADRSISYVSPRFGGIEFRALTASGEGSTAIGRTYSASARYSSGPVDALLAWARQNGANNANGEATGITFGGSYDLGPAKLFLGMVNEKNSCATCTGALMRTADITGNRASEFRLTNIGVRVPMGGWTAYAQATRVQDRSQYDTSPGDRDGTWFALGAEYQFSKRTMVYGTVATIGNKNGSNYALGSGTTQQPANAVGAGNPRSTTMAIGLRHAF